MKKDPFDGKRSYDDGVFWLNTSVNLLWKLSYMIRRYDNDLIRSSGEVQANIYFWGSLFAVEI